ncbi:MAG TPA: hypothetical protein VJU54_10970 [Nitrospiraceae bacterium]|nr:hypothetical protein [Nitrospiraceae bacterium]
MSLVIDGTGIQALEQRQQMPWNPGLSPDLRVTPVSQDFSRIA